MKVTSTLLAATSLAIAATAQPNPVQDDAGSHHFASDIGACGVPGEPCHVMKRAALAIDSIIARHMASEPKCDAPNSRCEYYRQAVDSIAESAIDGYDAVVKREADLEDRESKRKNFFGWCGAPGAQCYHKRENETEAELPSNLIDHCDSEASFCFREATADPETRALHKRCQKDIHFSDGKKITCEQAGELQWHKTDPYAAWPKKPKNCHPNQDGIYPKDCHGPGMNHKQPIGFCAFPGASCMGYKRDLGLNDNYEVAKPDGFRSTLKQIRDVVNVIKREAVAERAIVYPKEALKHCGKSRCSPVTHAHLNARSESPEEADYAELVARGPDGVSYKILPYLDAIEDRADAALSDMEKED